MLGHLSALRGLYVQRFTTIWSYAKHTLGYFVSHITDLALYLGCCLHRCSIGSDWRHKQRRIDNMIDESKLTKIEDRINQTNEWLAKGEYNEDDPYHRSAKEQLNRLEGYWEEVDADLKNADDSQRMNLTFAVDQLENTLSVIPKTQSALGGLCSRVMGKVSNLPNAVQTSVRSIQSKYDAWVEFISENRYMLTHNHDKKGVQLSTYENEEEAIHILAKKETDSYVGRVKRTWTELASGKATHGYLVTADPKNNGSDITLTEIDGVMVMATTYTPAPTRGGSK